jgi:hypothetical protein
VSDGDWATEAGVSCCGREFPQQNNLTLYLSDCLRSLRKYEAIWRDSHFWRESKMHSWVRSQSVRCSVVEWFLIYLTLPSQLNIGKCLLPISSKLSGFPFDT